MMKTAIHNYGIICNFHISDMFTFYGKVDYKYIIHILKYANGSISDTLIFKKFIKITIVI